MPEINNNNSNRRKKKKKAPHSTAACWWIWTPNNNKRRYLPDCFHPFPFPNARLARCVYVSVWATVEGTVCDFFQTGDWEWGRSHYAGRITQSTPKWGAGACQRARPWAHAGVYVCVCRQGPAGDLFSMSHPWFIYCALIQPLSLSLHTCGQMISSISVIR